MSIFAQDQGVLSLSLPVPGSTNKGRFPRLEQDSQVRDRSYNRLPLQMPLQPSASASFWFQLRWSKEVGLPVLGLSGVFTKWLFHHLLNVIFHGAYNKHISVQHNKHLDFLKAQGTVTLSNTWYLSKSKNVKLYDNSEMSTGLHFGTFLQYSNYIFFPWSAQSQLQEWIIVQVFLLWEQITASYKQIHCFK